MVMIVVADTIMTTNMTMKSIPMSMVMIAAVVMNMSIITDMNTLTYTVTSAVADTTMATSMNMLTHTVMNAVAVTTTDMSTKNTLTHTGTNAVADMTTDMNMNTLMHMVMNAAADMITAMSTLTHTDITFPVILLTAIVKSAIRMRNTAMYAAKAWLIAPAVCRMPTR